MDRKKIWRGTVNVLRHLDWVAALAVALNQRIIAAVITVADKYFDSEWAKLKKEKMDD